MEKTQINVLLIDDDEVTNMINTRMITKNFPYKVKEQLNAHDALADLKHWQTNSPEQMPAVIFLDINMADMDGWEFLDHFEKLPDVSKAGCTVIMLTSSIDTEDIERSKRYPSVKEFVSKPLTVDKLKTLTTTIPAFNEN